jgi:hypothetical protein
MLPRCFLALALIAGSLPAGQIDETAARPTAEQQSTILAAMAHFAEQYVSNLPNFLCLQTTEQYEGNKKGEHWKKGDTLASRLAFSDRKEHRTLEQVNNRPVQVRSRAWRRPLRTEGEFGPMLANLFADASDASFEWRRWDTLDGHRVAVLDYKIDRDHSQLRLGANYVNDVTVAYHGSVYGDPTTGEVFQLSSIASEIPAELPQREVATTVAYDYVTIGTSRYLLPSHVTVVMKTDKNAIRNESDFRDYKKFEAESTLKFGSDSSTDPPTNK